LFLEKFIRRAVMPGRPPSTRRVDLWIVADVILRVRSAVLAGTEELETTLGGSVDIRVAIEIEGLFFLDGIG
jgi:hypothetical protein